MNITKILVTAILTALSAAAFATPVVLNLVTDDFPEETWFDMMDGSNTSIAYESYTGAPLSGLLDDGFLNFGDPLADHTSYSFTWDLAAGDYTFMIFDSFNNGICCAYGSGSYELIVDGITVGSGGDYGSGMLEMFTVQATAIPESGVLALLGISLIGLGLVRGES